MEAHDTAWIGRRHLQHKGRVDSFGKQSLSAAQDERIEQQMKLIDQVVLEQRVDEFVAPICEDVLAGRSLELPNRLDDVVANDRRRQASSARTRSHE